MQPEVRHYSDPLEGLAAQLIELRGLSHLVPPMIEADRQRRWDEINARPSDGEDGDTIDVYGNEAGPMEGYGFAEFDQTVRAAAVVFAWAVFEDYLVPDLRWRLHDGADRRWGRLDDVAQNYRGAGVTLSELSGWDEVRHAHALRNAIVHNQRQYTSKYLGHPLAYWPTSDDLSFLPDPLKPENLIDREVIPLSREFVDGVIKSLDSFAWRVRQAIQSARLPRLARR